MAKKIFMTGATGFVGAYLLRQLVDRGYQVRALHRRTSRTDLVIGVQQQVEWVEGDIMNLSLLEDEMQGMDEVYHAAALVSFDPRDKDKMFRINGTGTANVVNAALHTGVGKLLHVSSIAALGRKPFRTDIDESIQWENNKLNSGYAISKFKGENEVWRGIEEGLNAVIVNPSVVLGGGFWSKGTSKFFPRVWKGQRFYPKGATGFVDVRDVARAAIELMESDQVNERFILNSVNWSYQELLNKIADALDKKRPTQKASNFIMGLAWRWEALRCRILGKKPLLTKETARTSSSTFRYRNDKIKESIGYTFYPVSKTIEETAALYKVSAESNLDYGLLRPLPPQDALNTIDAKG